VTSWWLVELGGSTHASPHLQESPRRQAAEGNPSVDNHFTVVSQPTPGSNLRHTH
jgi:hypothetical protein